MYEVTLTQEAFLLQFIVGEFIAAFLHTPLLQAPSSVLWKHQAATTRKHIEAFNSYEIFEFKENNCKCC